MLGKKLVVTSVPILLFIAITITLLFGSKSGDLQFLLQGDFLTQDSDFNYVDFGAKYSILMRVY